jgi:hypothetical protein
MKITTIPQLIKELHHGASIEGYMGLMERVHIKRSEILPYATWNKRHYTRNLIERNNDFELLLVGWEPGQKSPIHSYGDEQGWMYVVEGELVINHYFKSHGDVKMQFYKEVRLLPENYLYVNDYLGFHSVTNSSKGRTLSLHLHARPVEGWTVYDPETNAFFNVKTRIDSEGKVPE